MFKTKREHPMKNFALALLILSPAVFGQTVKTCNTVLPNFDGGQVAVNLVITRNAQGNLESRVIENGDSSDVVVDTAAVESFTVRAGITAGDLDDVDDSDFNLGEKLISHAMALLGPELEGMFSLSLDLSKVRSVKVYTLGDATNMGQVSIIEAKDAQGRDMGSFVGGFLIGDCK
jgi:hypothetical protein